MKSFLQKHGISGKLDRARAKAPAIGRQVMGELKTKRPWQSYLLAAAMVCCVFLMLNGLVAESSAQPKAEPPQSSAQKSAPTPETFSLADAEPTTSVWEESQPELGLAEPSSEVVPTDLEPKPLEVIDETEEAQAKRVVSEFYSDLDGGKFDRAYLNLSPEFRQALSFETFRRGYQALDSLSCTVKNSEVLADGRVRLDIHLETSEAGNASEYFATCLLRRDGDRDWKLSGIVQLRG